jgi:hypothetical protein
MTTLKYGESTMNATPMTDGANQSTRTTSRPFRMIRWTAFLAVAIAVVMALPLPALAGAPSLPYAGLPSAVGPGHLSLEVSPSTLSALPADLQRVAENSIIPPGALAPARTSALIRAEETAGSGVAPATPAPSALTGNSYLGAPCSTSSSITAVNGTNSSLLAGLSSNYLFFNGTGGTFCSTTGVSPALFQHGFVESEKSSDSGQTWTPGWIPLNTSWTNVSSPINGSIPGIWYPLGSGTTGAPYSSPAVASSDDGTALLATQYFPGCFINGCTTAEESDPAGVAIARSTDGGTTWQNTTVLSQDSYLEPIVVTGGCVGVIANGSFYIRDMPFSPSVAINPATDVAVAAWQEFDTHIDEGTGVCAEYISGTIQASYSTNGGVSWSAPKNVSSNLSFNPIVAVGPSPSYTISILFQNWLNGTIDSTTRALASNWAVTQSANGGSTWSTPSDTGAAGDVNDLWRGSSSPESFQISNNPIPAYIPNQVGYAVDSNSASPGAGNQYIVWSDNRSVGATDQGFASIEFQAKTIAAGGWLSPIYLTGLTRSTVYLEPAISVAPDGTVWVTFYGMSESSGDLTTYAMFSNDSGAKWSAPSLISTASSVLPTGIISIGDYIGLAATSAGVYATWMDCRTSGCTVGLNESVIAALVEPVGLNSNVNFLNVSVTTAGNTQTVELDNGQAWAIGTTHSVTAPGWFQHNATTVASFSNYSGVVNATTFTATFNYTGGLVLDVNYLFVPGAFIAGVFSPNTTQSRLTIDGTVVTLHPLNASTETFNYSVAAGREYFVNASASNLYASVINDEISVQAGQTTVVNISLGKTVGWLTGRVAPVNATLLLDGRAVSINASDGIYNVTVPWGSYWLNASGYGVTNASKFVTVTPGAATNTPFILIGGWLKGTVAATYPGLTITVDGLPITGLVGATFNESFLGGRHTVVATAPGYNTSFQNWTVTPGRTTNFAITLTNIGIIVGNVGPVGALGTALLTVNNVTQSSGGHKPINAITGNFAVNATGEVNWTLTVTATGYVTQTQIVFVRPGEDTKPVTFVLAAVVVVPPKQNCTNNASLCPVQQTNNAGISPLLVGGILVVVVLVAVIAAVVLMRRRPGGGDSTPPEGSMGGTDGTEAGSDTYGGAPPSG